MTRGLPPPPPLDTEDSIPWASLLKKNETPSGRRLLDAAISAERLLTRHFDAEALVVADVDILHELRRSISQYWETTQ